ncbi:MULTISPECIES: carboxylesterase family protein [unclassified Microbacterium]|uniref:carboxylesterase/lipase family protein n=1 Tax=unclassified Microbacterium TaxID=2609290 RepID=UPI00214C9033|nr:MULTISPECIES: carboxylesterase family protein [unclassified Microbacterium]MCR2808687.1 carboxylesterase family protein [Microbacterium sp. zg.B185]WIM18881.1 carboxylesterase family protein [Microbacterium sp. zg-B185]
MNRQRPLEVRVTGGVIRGIREGDTTAWRGIPYSAAPVGPLRFRSPRRVAPWSGCRDAAAFGPVAPQVHKGQFTGTPPGVPSAEDCLTVNVVAPSSVPAGGAPLPVMVFIHGGGYTAGSSQDFTGQGRNFVDTGRVVYVSFNYRLGALGYLDFSRYSTRRRPMESNLGLRDQIAALRWVHRNIHRFGGDPGRVTVFGESAGGNAVTTLMGTPSARGLFARAIAQSAPPDAVYSRATAAGWAEQFVEILRGQSPPIAPGGSSAVGLDAARDDPLTVEATVALLTGATPSALANAALVLQVRTPAQTPGTFCLAPVIDGRLVPRHPIVSFRTGTAHRVPLIIGTNDREGTIFRGRIDILPKSAPRIAAVLGRGTAVGRDLIARAYPGLPGAAAAAADFGGDYAFWYPCVAVAERHARYAPVYFYRFDVAPRLMRWAGLDATHGLELLALFEQGDARLARTMTSLGGRKAFDTAGARMRDAWLRFAAVGAPPESWPSYAAPERLTLIIADQDRVQADPRAERRRAWTALLPLG